MDVQNNQSDLVDNNVVSSDDLSIGELESDDCEEILADSSGISTQISDIVVGSDFNVSAVLKDENGAGVSNADIKYSFSNTASNTTTDANGLFTIACADNVVLKVIFEGKDNYLPTNTTIALNNLGSTRLGSGFNFTNGFVYTTLAVDYTPGERGSWFECLLTDSNGNPIANADVYFGINGFIHNKTSDENGLVRLQINLREANTYTCAVSFLGDDNYNASFAVAKLIVKKKSTSIKASAKKFKASAKTKKYTVTLKTVKGASADGKTYLQSNKKVTLKVNGKTYSGKTNAKGQVTFKLKLTKKGKYRAVVKFAGDKTYSASSKTVKYITIK